MSIAYFLLFTETLLFDMLDQDPAMHEFAPDPVSNTLDRDALVG